MLIYLQGAPRRPPITDWLSQVQRIVERRTGEAMIVTLSPMLEALYDCGVSPHEVADDLLA